jgi:hypothetical protein
VGLTAPLCKTYFVTKQGQQPRIDKDTGLRPWHVPRKNDLKRERDGEALSKRPKPIKGCSACEEEENT